MLEKSLFKRLNFIIIIVFAFALFSSGQAYALKDSQIPNLQKIKNMVIEYRKSGDWNKEIEAICDKGIEILNVSYNKNEKQAIVLDIDETSLDNFEYYTKNEFGFDYQTWFEWVDSAKAPAINGTHRIYDEAIKKGIYVFFVSGRPEKERNCTDKNLKAVGYIQYEKLILRNDEERKMTAVKYKSAARQKIENSGYHIILNVGDQHSDLLGGHSQNILKIPNPMYYIP